MTTPATTDPADVQHEMDFQLYGAIAATRAVLPAMREAGADPAGGGAETEQLIIDAFKSLNRSKPRPGCNTRSGL